jgi:CO dehydrogenase/acetyl-CoA synthase delta subunit
MSKSCCPPKTDAPAETTSCCPPKTQNTTDAPTGFCPPQQPASNDCCPPMENSGPCCSPKLKRNLPGYRLEAYVTGWIPSAVGEIPQVGTRLSRRDSLGAWQMRWGIGRAHYTIAPGLYAVGQPDDNAPVLISANYKLSFDALRKELGKIDAWILVIDTKGINVWCAAGKGTFGTDEIVRRVKSCGLDKIVSHRQLIVPQLGAPGVAAHAVARQTGFKVVYGPVRASDLPAFLLSGLQATAEMRRVTFKTRERLILTPVELVMMNRVSGWVIVSLFLLGGIGPSIYSLSDMWYRGLIASAVYLAGLLTGAVLTPILLPWIPGAALAWKGVVAGLATAVLACGLFAGRLDLPGSLALLLALPAVASYCAMNFTGSTTYTSPSGVEKEMRLAIPLQALALLGAATSWFWGAFSGGS